MSWEKSFRQMNISFDEVQKLNPDNFIPDKDILLRGAFIALLDPTIISLFSGRMTIQVLYAIGVSMMCMVLFRRLSSTTLLILALSLGIK